MDNYKRKSRFRHTLHSHKTSYTLRHFSHDLLVFLAYFVNNFLLLCYFHIAFKTFFFLVNCLNQHYTPGIDFATKCLEVLISYFIIYTWINKHSGKFDGYAFHHVLYYRYGIINFRDMVSRTLGTLAASGCFGYLYYTWFPSTDTDHYSQLKQILFSMLKSKNVSTLMDSLVYSYFNWQKRSMFLREYFTRVFPLTWLKHEDKYYELVDKYLALLFECFVVESVFSMFVYTVSSLMLKSRTTPRANLAFSTFMRNVFVTTGNMFLQKVDGKITLDESRWVLTFVWERNLEFLFLRLMANLLGALIIPYLVPLPRILPLHEHTELYPNTKLEAKTSTSEFSYTYFVESGIEDRVVNCSKWPDTKLGKLFLRLDCYLQKMLRRKRC